MLGASFAVTGLIIAVLGFNLTLKNRWLAELFPSEEELADAQSTNATQLTLMESRASIDSIPRKLQVFSYIIGLAVVTLGLCVIPTVLRKKPICVCCYIFWLMLALITMILVSLPFLALSTFREHHVQ
jgi:hypothetical protein